MPKYKFQCATYVYSIYRNLNLHDKCVARYARQLMKVYSVTRCTVLQVLHFLQRRPRVLQPQHLLQGQAPAGLWTGICASSQSFVKSQSTFCSAGCYLCPLNFPTLTLMPLFVSSMMSSRSIPVLPLVRWLQPGPQAN